MSTFREIIQTDKARYVDMLESLRRGAAVCYDSADALLLREANDTYILGAAGDAAGQRALSAMPAEARLLVVRSEALAHYAVSQLGFDGYSTCYQVYYDAPAPMPSADTLVIRHPTETDWPAVRDAYHLIDEHDLYAHFVSEDFFCGYCEGHLAAFAGLHSEGAMGMLYIFPPYRRRGFAEEMSAFMVNRQRALGRYAYAHIFADNEASLALQHKTGMSFSPGFVYWIWKEKKA